MTFLSLLKTLNNFLRIVLAKLSAFILLILLLCVLYGVATRYIFNNQATFTDELARMLLIITTFIGAAYAFAIKANIALDYFVGLMDKGANILSKIFADILVIAFIVVVLIIGGCQLVETSKLSGNHLISIDFINMWHIYLCVPISGVFMLLFAIESIADNIKDFRK